MYAAEAERLHGVLDLLICFFLNFYLYILFGQTEHRIEDTRSQVQYPRHQSLRTLIKTMKIIRHTHYTCSSRCAVLEYAVSYVHYSKCVY